MTDFEGDDFEEMDEDLVIVMTDEEGKEYYYREEMIIPVGEKKYAVLVRVEDECEDECECDEECDCDEEDMDVFIARIDTSEDGEDVYVDPTDEEFEQVREAYIEIMEEEDGEEA